MSGRALILVVIIFLAGCSVARQGKDSVVNPSYGAMSLPERTATGNLTKNDFNIDKAEIEIINNGEKQKLLANLKYRYPGIYLLSMKSKAGIEAARIYITKDTLMINDRIYKKLYYGSTEYLSKKYGISADALPLVTGDFLYDFNEHKELAECISGIAEIEDFLQAKKIRYSIDCEKAKVTAATIFDENKNGLKLKFDNFRLSEGFIFPKTIQIEDISKQTQIKIEIASVKFMVSGDIEFIPGRNFEKILLK